MILEREFYFLNYRTFKRRDKMELRFELPEASKNSKAEIEKLREEFFEKIAGPFNEIFEPYKTADGMNCFDIDTGMVEGDEVAWGVLYTLLQDREIDEEPKYYFHFYLDGRGEVINSREEIVKTGSWSEILEFVLKFIKEEIKKVEKGKENLIKIEKALKVLKEEPRNSSFSGTPEAIVIHKKIQEGPPQD
jgi:hypothetical protein